MWFGLTLHIMICEIQTLHHFRICNRRIKSRLYFISVGYYQQQKSKTIWCDAFFWDWMYILNCKSAASKKKVWCFLAGVSETGDRVSCIGSFGTDLSHQCA